MVNKDYHTFQVSFDEPNSYMGLQSRCSVRLVERKWLI